MPPPSVVRKLAGGCLCGACAYRVADAFRYAMNCHCSECRRSTGAAFKPLAGIERHHLELVAGADAVRTFGAEGWHNVFCGRCGSLLFSVVKDGTLAHVPMGTLADAPTIRPTMHIFTASKAPWFTITDDLPRHEAFPPD